MEETTKTQFYNPVEIISNFFENGIIKFEGIEPRPVKLGHINFDKDVIPQYNIIRQSGHDGTFLFTQDLIAKTLLELIQMETCYKPTFPEDATNLKEIHYTVGELKLETTLGMINMKAGRYPGVTDVVIIPVRCEYIY